jgi:hypothetical protein
MFSSIGPRYLKYLKKYLNYPIDIDDAHALNSLSIVSSVSRIISDFINLKTHDTKFLIFQYFIVLRDSWFKSSLLLRIQIKYTNEY